MNRAQCGSNLRQKFFKTRLCPHHFKKGSTCKGGAHCSYAHSFSELRPSVDLTKTKICNEFLNGSCTRPIEKCPFAHGYADLRRTGNRRPDTYKGARKLHPATQPETLAPSSELATTGAANLFLEELGVLNLNIESLRDSHQVNLYPDEKAFPRPRCMSNQHVDSSQFDGDRMLKRHSCHYPGSDSHLLGDFLLSALIDEAAIDFDHHQDGSAGSPLRKATDTSLFFDYFDKEGDAQPRASVIFDDALSTRSSEQVRLSSNNANDCLEQLCPPL